MNQTYEYPQDDTMQQTLTFTAGLLVGAVLGAGAMLILAPQSGKKTRGQIQKQSNKLIDHTTDAVEGVVEKTGDKARQIGSDIGKQAKELEHRGQDLLHIK